ncbi:MAG: chloride channel protein [Granulosicoccus sp.]|nr:chloride channel protein [Granulosicoccus sp.]
MASSFRHTPIGNRLVFFALAALVGMTVGLATVALIQLIAWVQYVGFGGSSEVAFVAIAERAPDWRVVAAPTVGGLIVGIFLFTLPGGRYHGIADVMEACAFHSGRMGVRSGVGAALAAGVTLGCGAPLGREGPAVHIGASLASWFSERLGLNRSQSLALLGCGAAAAVTTSFNAPIAGVLFALEVIVGYYTLRVFAPVVVASLVAVVVRHLCFGSEPLYELPQFVLGSLWEMPLFALLGVVSAVLISAFIYMVGQVQKVWLSVGIPIWLRPAIAGLLIGLVALVFPHVLGLGVESIQGALTGSLTFQALLLLLCIKTLATILALGSGFAGGVFSPAVFTGAMLGGLFWFLPDSLGLGLAIGELSQPGVYAIVGMAGVASAMLGAPISTVLIVFEITRSYEVVVAVMISAAFSTTVMQLGKYTSFFRWQLERRGVNISAGRDVSILVTHTISNLVSDHYTRITDSVLTREAEFQLGAERRRVAIVFNEENQFVGSTDLRELVAHSINHGIDQPIMDAVRDNTVAVNRSTNVVTALQTMAEHDIEYLPVTRRHPDEQDEFLGVIFKSDLLAEHYAVLRKAREEEFGVN